MRRKRERLGSNLLRKRNQLFPEEAAQELGVYIGGRVTKVQLPDINGPVNPIYKNSIFF